MPLHPPHPFARAAGLPAIAVTIALAAAGGWIARHIGAPLPMLLGSLVAVAIASLAGLKIGGRSVGMHPDTRLYFIPVIGVSIGAAFTPALFAEAAEWWPSLLALFLYIPAAHLSGMALYRRFGRLDLVTSYYAAAPGGLIDVIQMGEEAGAQMRPLITLQFLRLILTILLIPLAFMLATGHAVGSAAGAHLAGSDAPMGWTDALVLLVAGAAGSFGGRRMKLPAGTITGPIILSAAAHLGGLTTAAAPDWLIAVTQLVIGASLGARFVGLTAAEFARSAATALMGVLSTLALAGIAALLLSRAVGERPEAVILAFAPGGLAEMSLVAVSMQISVVFVTAHHVVRLLLAVAQTRLLRDRFGAGPKGPAASDPVEDLARDVDPIPPEDRLDRR